MEIHLDSASEHVVQASLTGLVRESGPDDHPLDQLDIPHIHSRRLLLNMAGVKMLNSNGLGWLLTCNKRCRAEGGRLVLHSLPTMAMNVVKMMRLNQVLTIAADEQQALQLFAETQP